MIRAIFFDIDGTLFSHKTKRVPESTKKALHLLREKGIFTFIATGRHIQELEFLALDDLEFEGFLLINGQYCYNERGMIYEDPIPREDIENLIQEIERNPFPCVFVEGQTMYMNFYNEAVMEAQNAVSTPPPPLDDLYRGLTKKIYQIMFYGLSEEREEEVLSRMPHCKSTKWHELASDVIQKEGGKRNGIEHVLEVYGIDRSEAMAFGDADNDVDMFELVGTAVAMGNANEAAKQAADYITEDIDDDGIHKALQKFGVLS